DRVDFRLGLAAGDVDLAVRVDVDVHLAADAELGQVDPRLDAEARPPDHPPVLAGFQPVHVGPVPVDLLPDVVPGPVGEVLAVPGLLDHLAGRVIDLRPGQRLVRGEGVLHLLDPGVPPRGHDVEHLRV